MSNSAKEATASVRANRIRRSGAQRTSILYLLVLSVAPTFFREHLKLEGAEPNQTTRTLLARKDLTEAKRVLKSAVDKGTIAGFVAQVMQRGKPQLAEAYGEADVHRPMKMDTIFRIASMTKPITSAAIMMLVEEHKVSLDDPLSKFIPEFGESRVAGESTGETVKLVRPITIRDLLTHTSGIAYGLNPPEKLKAAFQDAQLADGLNSVDRSLAENMRALAHVPLLHQPGEAVTYGMNTDVLGRVVEVASGQGFDQFLKDRIFIPLKMVDTGFFVPEGKQDRLAAVYRPLKNSGATSVAKVDHDPETVGSITYSASRVCTPPNYLSGGAGLVSTVADYSRFLTMLQRGGELDSVRLLKPNTIKTMTSNQIGGLPGPNLKHGDKFGFGFAVVTQPGFTASVGTYSWGGFYFTYFWVDPELELVAVLMTQLYPWGDSNLWFDFQKAVYAGLREASE